MPDSSHKLSPCPSSPNCVSSLATDRKHAIEPLRYTGSRAKARQRLMKILGKLKRTRVIVADSEYIRVEFRSVMFNFVDDVEFLFGDDKNVIHVKSASRVGYYDFGANRKRVEQIRSIFDGRRGL